MIRRPPRSTLSSSSAASDVYKRQGINAEYGTRTQANMEGLPTSLRNSIKRFDDAANATMECGEEVVAYYIKMYMATLAISKGRELAAHDPAGNQAARAFAASLIGELTPVKERLGDQLEGGDQYMKEYAVNMCELAEIEDLGGLATTVATQGKLAKQLQEAHLLFETCKQFGDLDQELSEKNQYAMTRTIELMRTIKQAKAEGSVPAPAPISPAPAPMAAPQGPVSYTHLRAHETPEHLVCRLLLEKKKKKKHTHYIYIIIS
eukprot:TRINITY_DN14281_c0_g1_i5.p1 TRINITY_DN14281_c0_g1~~TRINITY_DN14281_c0_g1_i5.p1  ORF type:complete len:263 (+),score=74.97 TRINITY_DN14281_c0_g1_i5:94-882(+)